MGGGNELREGGEGVVTVLLGGLGSGEVLQDLVGRGTGFIDWFLDIPLAWFRFVNLFLIPMVELCLIINRTKEMFGILLIYFLSEIGIENITLNHFVILVRRISISMRRIMGLRKLSFVEKFKTKKSVLLQFLE